MKNKMEDVRNHLVAMLEELSNPEAGAGVIERAKATSLVATTYVAAVKTEIDALRLADEIGRVPTAVTRTGPHAIPTDAGAPVAAISGPRAR